MDVVNALLGEQGSTEIQDELKRKLHENRIIIVNDEISDWLLEECTMFIILWNLEDKHIPVDERTPIKLLIDSDGGSPVVANNILNIIECSETPVFGIACSVAASAACSLLIGCHKRYAFKHSVGLIHDGFLGVQQTNRKAKDTMKFFDKIDEITKNLILTRTNIDENEYEENKDREQYFIGQELKDKGIVDGIIGIDIKMEELFK